jgi:hypothetical protein
MDSAAQRFETAYLLDQAIEFAESANDELSALPDAFDEEIDSWARRALAANGFGDHC